MLYDLATIHDELDRFEGQEVTVRCRVRSDAMSGDQQGQKTLYEIDDPRGNLDIPAFLSFWTEEPQIPNVSRTAGYVLDTLEEGVGDTGPLLDMGEAVLVRGVPKRSTASGEPQLFLNVTSVVIRSPDLQIGKGEMAVRSRCPRRYYLTFVKKVYNPSFPVNGHAFRGDVVHRAAERAVEEEFERFIEGSWNEEDAIEYVETVLDEEFGIRMAQLTISGIGLWGRDHAKEIVARLFTSEEFCDQLADADPESVSTERALADAYGYRGDVDLVIDGTPYDFKTSREVNRNRHARQLQLYLFGLLLEQADVGDDLGAALDTVPEGYLVYPNLEETDSVRFEPVSLTRDDVRELLELRNAVADARDPFGPPSPYNRDCEGCRLRTADTLVSPDDQDRPERDPLPSACKYHCQTERRWPCYEVSADGGTTSNCSLFDECEQRLEYRDPKQVDHYNQIRKALGAEERARRTASDLVTSLDDSVLKRSGRLVEGLSLANATMGYAGFETDERIVPAFVPGDSVVLEAEKEGSVGKRVTFLGIVDGEYRFQFDVQQHLAFLRDDVTYRVRKTFDPENVSRKFLPYIDYAQRRGHNRHFEYEQEHGTGTEGTTVLDDSTDVTDYLDNTEVFLDIPVRSDRNAVLKTVVESLVTASYPRIDESNPVPEEGRRALVLGATPEAVEVAERALSDDGHYRMDEGATGDRAIRESDSQHEIQRRWRDSRSLLSSVQYALKTEQFHTLLEGAYGDREHSPRFFDVLVLLGAEELTEAEYLFLSDLADRIVAVGDRRGLGPSMISSAATEQGLDRSYFTWAHDRYASISVDEAVSLQLSGEGNQFVRGLYPDDAWQDAETEFSFLEIEGGELVTADEFEVQASVRARRGVPFELVFDASDTTASPFEIQSMLESRDYLDATALHEGEVALIDERPLFLESKRQLNEETDATHHRIVIRSEPTRTPEFSRAFLYNRPESTIIAQVVDEYDAEFVVTPFETHANVLREQLDEQGSEIPVRLPEQLGSDMAGRAIVSFGVSNEHGVLRPPLNEPEMLYRLLSCAEELLLVGHGPTLRSKRDLEELVDRIAEEYTTES